MNSLGFPVAAVVTAASTILSLVLGNKTQSKQSKQSAQSTQNTQNTQSTQAPQQQRVIVVMQKEKNYTKYIAIAACVGIVAVMIAKK